MLSHEELEHAKEALAREPTKTELAMLDVLWSEHCSYKSSQRWFHLFNTKSEKVYLGIGEGAGLVDIGDGVLLGVAMESHNHPSQIDPFNGAATGVGGIIRDVISQGCKAIGLMNCLRFGPLEKPRNAYLLEHVVRGISVYGNSVGIPTIGGEVQFDDSYDGNCLVNVVCVGTTTADQVIRSSARTPGHQLVLFGSTTGRDGIAGVSFASVAFSDEEEENRAAVQIGDPLAKKVVIDTLEELVSEKLLDGLQDFGGGGLTSAAGEMASRGGTGVRVNIEKIPLREAGMQAHEIVISESQERMLAVVSPGNLQRVLEILEENDTTYAVIGEVTDDGIFTVVENGEERAKLPIELLVEGFPEPDRPVGNLPTRTRGMGWLKEPKDYGDFLLEFLEDLNICDRSWIYEQYDQHVQTNTVVDIGDNAGVLELPLGKLLAFSTDCNSFWSLLDPYSGAANSACETMRNLVCMGARPILIADCLNFGNPERPNSYSQFVEAVKGLGQFSHDFDIPIVAGNVSFYNESEEKGEVRRINPTPQIMMAGVFDNGIRPIMSDLAMPWASIYLIGETHGELNGSAFQHHAIGEVRGLPPRYRPKLERVAMEAVLDAHGNSVIRSCNNVGRGGIAISLMKMLFCSEYGFKLDLEGTDDGTRGLSEILFSETPGRYIAEVTESNQEEFLAIMDKHGVIYSELGLTTPNPIGDFGVFKVPVLEARKRYRRGIRKYMT
jgi:phosphoribosylformylglycinamidine synthase